MSEPSVAELRRRLDGLTIRDAARLGRRLKNLRGAKPEKLHQLAEQLATAEALVATRQAALPTITYQELPVSERYHGQGNVASNIFEGATPPPPPPPPPNLTPPLPPGWCWSLFIPTTSCPNG